jgi:hypothetical protein
LVSLIIHFAANIAALMLDQFIRLDDRLCELRNNCRFGGRGRFKLSLNRADAIGVLLDARPHRVGCRLQALQHVRSLPPLRKLPRFGGNAMGPATEPPAEGAAKKGSDHRRSEMNHELRRHVHHFATLAIETVGDENGSRLSTHDKPLKA